MHERILKMYIITAQPRVSGPLDKAFGPAGIYILSKLLCATSRKKVAVVNEQTFIFIGS